MAIKKSDLTEMNDLLEKGKTIAQIEKKYPQYGYYEIYWEVNDYSFLGKKRKITNRLKKLVSTRTRDERDILVVEAQELLDQLYESLKNNSKKLIAIDRVLRKNKH